MGTFYLNSFVGVKDGTQVPADRSDGRKVGAKLSSIHGSKPAGVAWANGDKIYAGTLRKGETLRNWLVDVGTSLSTTTLDLGTLASPSKYATGKTLTATNTPTSLGPISSAKAAGPATADEDLYITLGVGGIADTTVFNSELVIASVK
jgi:hypothetical protein